MFQLCWQLFVVDVEIKLGVLFDGVQYNTGVGLPNVDIRQQLLDLCVHPIRVFKFADCDDIVVACSFVHTDHLVFVTEPVDDFCERSPFDFQMVDGDALKCKRVAVRPSDRGACWGERLMEICESIAHEHGVTECMVHAQQRVGDPFEEAGIPHVKMRFELLS